MQSRDLREEKRWRILEGMRVEIRLILEEKGRPSEDKKNRILRICDQEVAP